MCALFCCTFVLYKSVGSNARARFLSLFYTKTPCSCTFVLLSFSLTRWFGRRCASVCKFTHWYVCACVSKVVVTRVRKIGEYAKKNTITELSGCVSIWVQGREYARKRERASKNGRAQPKAVNIPCCSFRFCFVFVFIQKKILQFFRLYSF